MNLTSDFDRALSAAAEKYSLAWVDEIMATPIPEALSTITPREERRFRRICRNAERAARRPSACLSPWKIALIAILLALSAMMVACVCIPQVREAIKNGILDWYQEYVAVNFCGSTDGESPTAETPAQPPRKIEQKAYASYLPGEYRAEVDMESDYYYNTKYYIDGELGFWLSQRTIVGELQWLNNETAQSLDINGHIAILFINSDKPSQYIIVWRDGQYEYELYGWFSSEKEAIQVAEGICLQAQ